MIRCIAGAAAGWALGFALASSLHVGLLWGIPLGFGLSALGGLLAAAVGR